MSSSYKYFYVLMTWETGSRCLAVPIKSNTLQHITVKLLIKYVVVFLSKNSYKCIEQKK